MRKVVATKPKFKKVFRFSDSTEVSMSLAEVAYQYLAESARMFAMDDPEWRQRGQERLRQVASFIGKETDAQLWASVVNKKNASMPRPAARSIETEDDEIVNEFRRLVREGHSAREARGIMTGWHKWSQSTIYRRTKEEK